MTMNATETMALIDLSRKHNTLLMEAFMYKIHPQTQKIISLVKDRLQGPLQIKANFCFSVDVPEAHRLVNKDLGGGSILDISQVIFLPSLFEMAHHIGILRKATIPLVNNIVPWYSCKSSAYLV